MRLTSIWTTPSYPLRERLNLTREWAALKVAHRLPRRLAYWSLIDSGVRYMPDGAVMPEVTFFEVLEGAGVDLNRGKVTRLKVADIAKKASGRDA